MNGTITAKERKINQVSKVLSLTVVEPDESMVPVSIAAANRQWRRWKSCAETRAGHKLSGKTTQVGIRRCTVVLVPKREKGEERQKERRTERQRERQRNSGGTKTRAEISE